MPEGTGCVTVFPAATCAPACATGHTPAPAHLDVLEQEVGVEADVVGGHIEAAVVGHLSLPGAGEAAQQHILLGELPEGPAVAAVLLAQLREVRRWCPGTTAILQPPAPLPCLPRNWDEPSHGPPPQESIQPRSWGWGPAPQLQYPKTHRGGWWSLPARGLLLCLLAGGLIGPGSGRRHRRG